MGHSEKSLVNELRQDVSCFEILLPSQHFAESARREALLSVSIFFFKVGVGVKNVQLLTIKSVVGLIILTNELALRGISFLKRHEHKQCF